MRYHEISESRSSSVIQKLKDLIDHPHTHPNIREIAQNKLNDLTKQEKTEKVEVIRQKRHVDHNPVFRQNRGLGVVDNANTKPFIPDELK